MVARRQSPTARWAATRSPIALDFGGMPMQMRDKRIATPDEIKLDVSVFDMSFPLVLKKQKERRA
jgi:hypothetical protein